MKITIATKITISRILITLPALALFIAGEFMTDTARVALLSVACALFAIACITDYIDGYVARKFKCESELGKYLDPIADKVNLCLMLFAVIYFRDGLDSVFKGNSLVVAILGGVILTRELLVGMLRTMAAKRGKVVSSDIFGKIKTNFLNIGVIVLMVAGLQLAFAWIGTLLYYLGAVITVVSGVHYFAVNASVLGEACEYDENSECKSETREDDENSESESASKENDNSENASAPSETSEDSGKDDKAHAEEGK